MWVCVAYFLDAEAVKALKGVTHRLFDHERELYEDSCYVAASREARGVLLRPERRQKRIL